MIESSSDKEQDNTQELSVLEVNINDKISKLFELAQSSGFLINNNSTLTADKLDDTFAKAFINSGETFALLVGSRGGASFGEPMLWKRMKDKLQYYYIFARNIDAIEFIPKQKIVFMGWGQWQNVQKKDMNLKYKWEIDGQQTEWYDRTVLEEDMDQEENWTKINITKDFGVKPIVVNAGQSIHIMV